MRTVASQQSPNASTSAALGSAPASAPLEKYANKVSAADRRKARYLARAGLWRHSTLERCRKCGRVSRRVDGGVQVRYRDGHAGLAGLVTCGSVWACPVCNAKVMQRRALEVGAVIALAQAKGYVVAEATFTLRHHQGDHLDELWSGLAAAWKSVISGRQWIRERDAIGLVGFIRATEVTHGANGWHPHLHVVLVAERLDAATLRELHGSMVDRWRRAAVRQGLESPLAVGQEAHLLDGDYAGSNIGRYLTEAKCYGPSLDAAQRIGLELTTTQSKRARSAHSTSPTWDLLDGANNGETRALRLWREFERVSYGKRQIAYSRGLREAVGLDLADLTDEEIAAEELGTEEDTGVFITAHGWRRMTQNPDWIPDALTVLERLGWMALSEWLSDRRVEHLRI